MNVIVTWFEIHMRIFQFSSYQLYCFFAYLGFFLISFITSGIHKSISPSFAEQKLLHTVNIKKTDVTPGKICNHFDIELFGSFWVQVETFIELERAG